MFGFHRLYIFSGSESPVNVADKDVEMEAILKFRTGERPAKSARLQALTSGGSCSFNSGTDEVRYLILTGLKDELCRFAC